MILRRFLAELREQKWMTFAIEFVIVVLGVFLGLQAQQWSDDLKETAQQQRYMERLSSDFESLSARQQSHLVTLDETVDGASYLLGILELPADQFRAATFDKERIQLALRRLLGSRVPPGRSATYIEMLSASQLSFVRNAALRDDLAEYDRASDTSAEVFRWVTVQTQSAQPILMRHFRSSVVADSTSLTGFRVEIEAYDLDGMRGDPEFAIAVRLLLNGAANIRASRVTEHRLTTGILELLSTVQGARRSNPSD